MNIFIIRRIPINVYSAMGEDSFTHLLSLSTRIMSTYLTRLTYNQRFRELPFKSQISCFSSWPQTLLSPSYESFSIQSWIIRWPPNPTYNTCKNVMCNCEVCTKMVCGWRGTDNINHYHLSSAAKLHISVCILALILVLLMKLRQLTLRSTSQLRLLRCQWHRSNLNCKIDISFYTICVSYFGNLLHISRSPRVAYRPHPFCTP